MVECWGGLGVWLSVGVVQGYGQCYGDLRAIFNILNAISTHEISS